jgi:type I restriction enzyme S subunit
MSIATKPIEKKIIEVPLIRFPEFDGEWVIESIGKHITLISGIAFKGDDISEDAIGVPILRGINITEGYIRHNIKIDRYYLGNTTKLDKIRLKEGDLVVGMDGSKVGKNSALISKKDEGSLLIQRVARLRARKNVSLEFIYLHINSIKFHKYVDVVNTSSGIPHISSKQINDFKISFPSLPEQTKIASFLTAVDEKLTALNQKKILLEQYKKGVMQKIFSQELRFKDDNGNDFADWEEKNGNFIFESISDKKHNSDLPILAITQEFGAIPRDLIDYKVSVTDKSVDSYKVVQVGDFIISLRSFQGGIEYSNFKGICSPAYIILRPHVQINDLFFKTYFKTESYIFELQKNLEGIRDGKMISFKYFSEIKLPLPSIPEQTKTANFLAAIDEKINHCKGQIEKAEIWKKGLLQQLFV